QWQTRVPRLLQEMKRARAILCEPADRLVAEFARPAEYERLTGVGFVEPDSVRAGANRDEIDWTVTYARLHIVANTNPRQQPEIIDVTVRTDEVILQIVNGVGVP